jgi:hypothetical protein
MLYECMSVHKWFMFFSIVLTTWAYTTNEVYLTFADDPISTDDFSVGFTLQSTFIM